MISIFAEAAVGASRRFASTSQRTLIQILLVATFGSTAMRLSANLIQVPTSQPTIQAGINAAVNGDTVQVAPGAYVENINFAGKAITVTSTQGPQVTIIDGNHNGSVVTFNSGEGPQSVLSGFTLQHGSASVSSYDGGGIRIQNSSPTITGNIIINNDAADGGAGIYSNFGSPTIQGNTITNNQQTSGYSGGVGGGGISIVGASSAQVTKNTISNNSWSTSSGGGIALFAAGTPTLFDNLISNNSAYSQGGAIYIVNQSDALIEQNLIYGNTAPNGGGIYWLVPSGDRGPLLVNNTIAFNNATQGSGIFADGYDGQVELINNIVVGQNPVYCGSFSNTSVPIFQFNDVFSFSTAAYSGSCSTQTGLNGNISADPAFKSVANNDYHLQTGSPAIDAGTSNQAPSTDFDGIPRPQDGDGDGIGDWDLGVYEALTIDLIPPTVTATVSPLPNSAGWNNSNVTVTLTAADNPFGSGAKQIQYSLSGAQSSSLQVVSGSSASVVITAQGTTTLSYNAVDNAGNVEAVQTLTMKLDKAAPVISGMPAPGCTLHPPNNKLVQVANVTATDALSGVASLVVTATCNQPVNSGDIVINGGIVELRATGNRIYTINATAKDNAGNTSTATATCTVK